MLRGPPTFMPEAGVQVSIHWLLRINEIRKEKIFKLFFKEIHKDELLKASQSVCNVSTFEEFHFKTLTSTVCTSVVSEGSGGTALFAAPSAVGVDTRQEPNTVQSPVEQGSQVWTGVKVLSLPLPIAL